MKAMLCAALAAAAAVFCACRVLSASETAPATPKNLRISAGSGGSHTLAWDAVPRAEGYKIFCSSTWETWPALNDRETSSTSVSCSCEGYFTVSAFNSGGESAKAEPPVLYGPPASPTNVRVEKIGSLHYLSWDAVFGAEGYVVYYAAAASHPSPFVQSALASIPLGLVTQYLLTGSGNDYWVAAAASGGESEIFESVETAYQ